MRSSPGGDNFCCRGTAPQEGGWRRRPWKSRRTGKPGRTCVRRRLSPATQGAAIRAGGTRRPRPSAPAKAKASRIPPRCFRGRGRPPASCRERCPGGWTKEAGADFARIWASPGPRRRPRAAPGGGPRRDPGREDRTAPGRGIRRDPPPPGPRGRRSQEIAGQVSCIQEHAAVGAFAVAPGTAPRQARQDRHGLGFGGQRIIQEDGAGLGVESPLPDGVNAVLSLPSSGSPATCCARTGPASCFGFLSPWRAGPGCPR